MALDMRYPTPLPSLKGWGPGWPNCQTDKIVPHPVFQGGVRKEIKELVDLLVDELKRRGYVFHPGWSWGFGCRATKGGSGTVPSFHSWGLALDFNAPENVFGGSMSSSDLATKNRWVVDFMATYGFFWLGPSIGDWMHFSFTGSPQDVKDLTEKAKRELGDQGDEVAYADFKDGFNAYRKRFKEKGADPGPAPASKSADFQFGWGAARFAASNPKG